MPTNYLTLSEVIEAFNELGGEADWADVKARVTEKRGNDFTPYPSWRNYKNTMFQIVQVHCEDYHKFNGNVQFVKVPKTRTRFRLAFPNPPPVTEFIQPPSDIAAPPDRIEAHVQRIVRDTVAAKSLKARYDYKCQVCGFRIEPAPGNYYVEVHHVRPLGGGHNGHDTHTNMLVLCPNCHAMFDFGIPRFTAADRITIGETSHTLTCKHALTEDVIAYHNEHIHRRAASKSQATRHGASI
jgi:hypothetical protein